MILTGKERISRILKRQPVDRIGLYEHFWGDTTKAWQIDEDLEKLFDYNEIDKAHIKIK